MNEKKKSYFNNTSRIPYSGQNATFWALPVE